MTVLALEQTAPLVGHVGPNTDHLLGRARAALADGADVVVFPELADTGYVTDREEVARLARPLDSRLVAQLCGLTKRYGGIVVTGFCERSGDVFHNSVVAVDATGPVLHYRKLHLFDAEQIAYTPGQDLPVIETAFGVLGVCICYDLRFVEVLRALSLKGADIVLAPAAWVAGFDQHVPPTGLVQQAEAVVVQANLDQVAVVAVSQAPSSRRAGLPTLGGSVAVDAFGRVVAGPLARERQDHAVVKLEIAQIRAARIRGPRIRPREERRTDVYGVQFGEEIL